MEILGFNINVEHFKSKDYLIECLRFIDLTSLNATDTNIRIEGIVSKINDFPKRFPELPNVAAICAYPSFTGVMKKHLTAKDVQIAVTGAGFPASQTFLKTKVQECKMAVEKGADEVDIVMSLNHFLSGEYALVVDEISAIKEAIGGARLKVILESGALPSVESIAQASRIVMGAGADFIKTSTGKSEPAATPEAAVVMCNEILTFYQKTGKRVGLKPAGGIVLTNEALVYYAIVHKILGLEWLTPTLFRIGASRLVNNLLSEIYHIETIYF